MSKRGEKYSRRGLQTGYLSVVVGISLVLFMLGLVIGTYLGLDHLQNEVKENVEIDLFFNPDLNESDIKMIEQELKSWEEIKSVWFVSPQRALEIFQSNESSAAEIQSIFDGESPFPPSVSFNPKSIYVSQQGLETLRQKILSAYPSAVDEVNFDVNRVKQVNLGFLQWVYLFVAIGLLLTIIAFAMINNTIKLALYAKRFTIKTMQLVGAKSGFIRKPFLLNAIIQGLLSAIIGMALLIGVFYISKNYLEGLSDIFNLNIFVILFAALIVIGITISFISTLFALNKYLRKRLDSLY